MPPGPFYFSLYPLRFTFLALDALSFQPGTAANAIRGAFGQILRRLACHPSCPGFLGRPTRECPHAALCPYARLFEPFALTPGPSGLSDRPRPFVLRAPHLDRAVIPAGASFYFDLHLFETGPGALATIEYLTQTFSELSRDGLGPNRSRSDLIHVTRIDRPDPGPPLRLSLAPFASPSPLLVEFLTPTELKSASRPVSTPDFLTLFNRVRDRICTLSALYGTGPLPLDFQEMSGRAAAITLDCFTLRTISAERRSSRTSRSHGLGGFTGTAQYSGNLGEFLPWLLVAHWTGVGRHTVWGNGQIRVSPLSSI